MKIDKHKRYNLEDMRRRIVISELEIELMLEKQNNKTLWQKVKEVLNHELS